MPAPGSVELRSSITVWDLVTGVVTLVEIEDGRRTGVTGVSTGSLVGVSGKGPGSRKESKEVECGGGCLSRARFVLRPGPGSDSGAGEGVGVFRQYRPGF